MANVNQASLSTDISVDYPGRSGVLRDARLEVFPGEIVALVGQSGSGKSTLALAILRLLEHTGASVRGQIMLLGQDVMRCNPRQMRSVRGRVASLIPQTPMAALNPALRIEAQLREAWRAHSREQWSGQTSRMAQLFEEVGLPGGDAFLRRFPSEISVGQAQRVLITMALLHSPPLLIADEPTTALDVITQREVLDLLARIGKERNLSILFISHDLLTIANFCHRLVILKEGTIVESGPTKQVLSRPKHLYTQQLIAAIPKWDSSDGGPDCSGPPIPAHCSPLTITELLSVASAVDEPQTTFEPQTTLKPCAKLRTPDYVVAPDHA